VITDIAVIENEESYSDGTSHKAAKPTCVLSRAYQEQRSLQVEDVLERFWSEATRTIRCGIRFKAKK